MPSLQREICDSEDEEELFSPLKDSPARVATSKGGEDASAPAQVDTHVEAFEHKIVSIDRSDSKVDASESSTGSTLELLRQAHLDLMAPTQSAVDLATASAHMSPNTIRVKRRLTETDAPSSHPIPSASSGKLKRIKTGPAVSSQKASQVSVSGLSNPYYDENVPGDTIPGSTIPHVSANEAKTPSTRTRKPSISRPQSSAEQSSNLTLWSSSAVGNSSAAATNFNQPSSDPPNPEDDLIGLPVENYKPRPSRSRSDKSSLVEPSSYSVRPEKSTKAKRAKTIAHSPAPYVELDIGSTIFPKNPILQAPDFEALSPPPAGYIPTPLLPVPDLLHLDAELPQTVPESAVEAHSSGTQLSRGAKKDVNPKKMPGKRGRPKKNPEPASIVDEADGLGIEEICESRQHRTTVAELQVVITPRGPTPVAPDDPTFDAQHDISEIVAALKQKFPSDPTQPFTHDQDVPAAEPKKPAVKKLIQKQLKAQQQKQAREEKLAAAKAEREAEAEAEAEAASKLADEEDDVAKQTETAPTSETSAPLVSHSTPAADKTVESVKTPAVVKSPSVAKSSPMNGILKLGPRMRVGLSKTQRTQSLLKVVRK